MDNKWKLPIKRCMVPKCKSSSEVSSIQFFKLPRSEKRRKLWLDLMGSQVHVEERSFVCIKHFETGFLNAHGGKYKLKQNAIPSVNLASSLSMELSERKEQEQRQVPKIIQRQNKYRTIFSENSITLNTITPVECSRKKIKQEVEQQRIYNFKRNLKRLKPATKFSKHSKEEIYQLLALSNKYLPRNLFGVIKLQLELKENVSRTKLTSKYKEFALHMYYCSSSLYEQFRDLVQLPTIQSLKQAFNPRSFTVDEELISNFKIKVDMMTDEQKQCVVCVNEIDIQANLYYVINRDQIIGVHNVDGAQTMIPARKAIVVMIQGILKDWVQPIGMALLANDGPDFSLKSWIEPIISKLFNINLKVNAIITDINIAHKYNLLTKKSDISLNVDDKIVYYIFDIKYLLTDLRNGLVENNFHTPNNGTVKFLHVLWCGDYEGKRKYSLLPNFDNQCLKPHLLRDEFKYAVRLFRKSTAAAISNLADFDLLATDASGTCDFIDKISKLYDLLTIDTTLRKPLQLDQNNLDFLSEMVTLFENIQMISKKDRTNVTDTCLFVQGFITTINNIITVKLLLDPICEQLSTRKLTLNCTRSFFREVKKNQKSEQLSAKQVFFRFRDYFTSQLMKSPTEGESQEIINDFLTLINDVKYIRKYETISFPKGSCLYNFQEICKKNNITRNIYKTLSFLKPAMTRDIEFRDMAEFIFKQCNLAHKCYNHNTTVFCTTKAKEQFCNYIFKLNEKFLSYFYGTAESSEFLGGLLNSIHSDLALQEKVNNLCICFPYLHAKLLFCRIRLREELKFLNFTYDAENPIQHEKNLKGENVILNYGLN